MTNTFTLSVYCCNSVVSSTLGERHQPSPPSKSLQLCVFSSHLIFYNLCRRSIIIGYLAVSPATLRSYQPSRAKGLCHEQSSDANLISCHFTGTFGRFVSRCTVTWCLKCAVQFNDKFHPCPTPAVVT